MFHINKNPFLLHDRAHTTRAFFLFAYNLSLTSLLSSYMLNVSCFEAADAAIYAMRTLARLLHFPFSMKNKMIFIYLCILPMPPTILKQRLFV